jgi:hypothetical protein
LGFRGKELCLIVGLAKESDRCKIEFGSAAPDFESHCDSAMAFFFVQCHALIPWRNPFDLITKTTSLSASRIKKLYCSPSYLYLYRLAVPIALLNRKFLKAD